MHDASTSACNGQGRSCGNPNRAAAVNNPAMPGAGQSAGHPRSPVSVARAAATNASVRLVFEPGRKSVEGDKRVITQPGPYNGPFAAFDQNLRRGRPRIVG